MKLTHIEHIAIAVNKISDHISYYEDILGLKCYAIEEIKEQKVKTAFFRIGDTKIELLEPTDQKGPIGKFIRKHGEGLHHIAFAVNDIKSALSEVKSKGIELIDHEAKRGAENLHIAFLHPKSTGGVLTEFCENKSK